MKDSPMMDDIIYEVNDVKFLIEANARGSQCSIEKIHELNTMP